MWYLLLTAHRNPSCAGGICVWQASSRWTMLSIMKWGAFPSSMSRPTDLPSLEPRLPENPNPLLVSCVVHIALTPSRIAIMFELRHHADKSCRHFRLTEHPLGVLPQWNWTTTVLTRSRPLARRPPRLPAARRSPVPLAGWLTRLLSRRPRHLPGGVPLPGASSDPSVTNLSRDRYLLSLLNHEGCSLRLAVI